LVAQEYQVPGGPHKRCIEIAAVAEILLVTMEFDFERRGFGELSDNGFSFITRTVVCDDQLVWLASLVYEALKLGFEILGAVVGGHGYGDFHCFCSTIRLVFN